MRTVDDYLVKAAEFDDIADETKHPELKRRYRDLARSYKALAEARQRAINDGSAEPHILPQ